MRTLARAPDWGKPATVQSLGRLVTPHFGANSYSVIDVLTNTIVYDKIALSGTRDVEFGDGYVGIIYNAGSPFDGYILFLNRNGAPVTTVNPTAGNVILSNIAYGDGYFVVVEQFVNALTIINSTTLTVVGRVVINATNPYNMNAVTPIYVPDDNAFYFGAFDASDGFDYWMYKLDMSTFTLSRVHYVGDNGSNEYVSLAYDATRYRLFCSYYVQNSTLGVDVYDLSDWSVVGTITRSAGSSFDAPELSIVGDVLCISDPIGSVNAYDISQPPGSWAVAQFLSIPSVTSVCHMYGSVYASTQSLTSGRVFVYRLNLSEATILNPPGLLLNLPSGYANVIAYAPAL